MSKTLNFADRLMSMGRKYYQTGQNTSAARVFRHLAKIPHLPQNDGAEVFYTLAQLELQKGGYGKARRHLAAAVARTPDHAPYHYLLATTVEDDPDGTPERALEHYRSCIELEPDNADYLCEYGISAVSLGRAEEGLTALRRAYELAPDEPFVLARLVEALRTLANNDEAKVLLRAAYFSHPHDRRFLDLCREHQFQLLFDEQQQTKRDTRLDHKEKLTLLPFKRPSIRTKTGKTIRTDEAGTTGGPNLLIGNHSKKRSTTRRDRTS